MKDPVFVTCVPAADGRCSICGDEATVARVVAIDERAQTAEVVAEAAQSTVALDLVHDVHVGDTLLVHMGFAIERVRGASAP
jgi:hydrogenase maturation factor